ncbi:unnamed protein product [Brassica rapa subsp. trilocularis]
MGRCTDKKIHCFMETKVLFGWLPPFLASAAASMRTVVVCFADADDAANAVADAAAATDATAYYIATVGFIGVSRRTQRSDAASCVNKTNKS